MISTKNNYLLAAVDKINTMLGKIYFLATQECASYARGTSKHEKRVHAFCKTFKTQASLVRDWYCSTLTLSTESHIEKRIKRSTYSKNMKNHFSISFLQKLGSATVLLVKLKEERNMKWSWLYWATRYFIKKGKLLFLSSNAFKCIEQT